MNRNVIPLKKLLLLNTSMLGVMALLSCWKSIEAMYVVFFAGILAIAAAIDASGRKHPSRMILNIASISILGASFLRMRYNNVIMVFTEGILLMTAVKMLEEKRSRDYCQIAALSVFTIVSAAIDVADESYIYLGIAESILVGFQFILCAWFAQDSESSLTPKEFFQTFGRTMAIWAMMIPVCLALFFVAPRARLTLGQMRIDSPEHTVGFSDRVALGSVSEIQEVSALAFRAEMPLVAPKYLFWRGLVLDSFNGNEWFAGMRTPPDRLPPQGKDMVKQSIFLESGGNYRAIFAMDFPMIINAQGVASVGDGVFVNTNYRNRVRSYSAVSSLSDSIRPASGRIRRERYLRLPENFSPSIHALADEIIGGVEDAGKPAAVMQYLSAPRFSYSLSGLPTSSAPLEEFLLQTRSGNCEYFATAMAVMLRMAGIPSRLVAGYHGGVYNDNGGYYMVNQSNAHVWVEAWDEAESAWRRYDPTPASNEAGGESGGTANYGFWRKYIDYINYNISRVFMEYGGETQSGILEYVRDFIASPGDAISALIEKFSPDRRKVYAAAAILIFLCLIAARMKYPRYGGAFRRRSRDDVLRERFLKAMKRRGFVKKPGDGLEEFSNYIGRRLGPNAISAAAEEFVVAFEPYYFRDAPIDAAEFKRLEGIIKNINKSRLRPLSQ
ncbi:MAG: DUF3488 and transglutaminase-like domain-containing protein [Synergistaceae bacterium]|jgi:hypothetical protein|nr:DUF3488 and transglutaminase-like domain-containing protein [Synergistaceae bacterium]